MPQAEQQSHFLPHEQLQTLLDEFIAAGYRCIGPQVRDGAIVYDTLKNVSQLPAGVRDMQAPGKYRLEEGADERYFAWANGPQALKPLVFSPRELLWRAQGNTQGEVHFSETLPQAEPRAVIGVRPCDVAALKIQDRHFLNEPLIDPYYAARREQLVVVAVNCTQSAATCFCASTGDGPAVKADFDLALTELHDGFIVESGSATGEEILARLQTKAVTSAQTDAAAKALQDATQQQRQLPSDNLRDALFANLDHPRWNDVAGRCLSCGNCTMVCPTCFCHNEVETPKLDGSSSEHYRQWDSCFTEGHSYIHGFVVRAEAGLRYRQWLTHKLGSWHDQYGRSGCVGCGRCISWCPSGIDLTQEVAAIRGEVEQ